MSTYSIFEMKPDDTIKSYKAATGETITSRIKVGRISDDPKSMSRISAWSKYERDPDGEFCKALQKFEVLSKNTGLLQLLSAASLRFLNRGQGAYEYFETTSIGFAQLELVQALLLRQKLSDVEIISSSLSNDFSSLWDFKNVSTIARDKEGEEALQLAWSLGAATIAKYKKGELLDDPNYRIQCSINSMRVFSHSVRNWAYPSQLIDLLISFSEPLDAIFLRQSGFKVSSIVRLIEKMSKALISKGERFFRIVKQVEKSNSMKQLVSAYHSLVYEQKPDYLEQALKLDAKHLARLKQIVLNNCWRLFVDTQKLSFRELRELFDDEIEEFMLHTILREWSLSFGDLTDHSVHDFILDNPVWQKPIIMLRDGIFVSNPNQLFSFIWNLIEAPLLRAPAGKDLYHDRRSDFLEEQVEKIVRCAFPSASVYTGSTWYDEKERKIFENDLMLVLDDQILLIESKAGKVHESAWRGGEKRLKSMIERLLIEPALQSERFETVLSKSESMVCFKRRDGRINRVDLPANRTITRLTVTLDSIANVFSMQELKAAGYIDKADTLVPAMTLPELQCIFELLQTEGQKLHYLRRRYCFESQATHYGDEFDLLAYYDASRFATQEDADFYLLIGASTQFENYFMRKEMGQICEPNLRALPALAKKIVSLIERERSVRWTTKVFFIRDFSISELEDIESFVRKTKNDLKRSIYNHELRWQKFVSNSGSQIIAVCCKGLTDAEISNELKQFERESQSLLWVFNSPKMADLPIVLLSK